MTIVDNVLALFATGAGDYAGLVNNVAGDNAATGFLQLKVTAPGRFTGKLILGGRSFPIAGALDSFGDFTGLLARGDEPPLTLTLHLDQSGNGVVTGRITGVAVDPSDPAAFTLARRFFNAASNPAPQAGAYSFTTTSGPLPADAGFGTLAVNGNGVARFAGTLGDGTRVSIGGALTQAGTVPFFAALYKPRGFITGTVIFQTTAASVADGALRCFRPANPKSKQYADGFDVAAQLLASAYAPANPVLNFGSQVENAQLVFTGGNLPLALPALSGTLGLDNKVTPSVPRSIAMKINLKTGLFTGSVKDPSTGKPRALKGTVYQRTTSGIGHFPGDGETGRVDLLAAP